MIVVGQTEAHASTVIDYRRLSSTDIDYYAPFVQGFTCTDNLRNSCNRKPKIWLLDKFDSESFSLLYVMWCWPKRHLNIFSLRKTSCQFTKKRSILFVLVFLWKVHNCSCPLSKRETNKIKLMDIGENVMFFVFCLFLTRWLPSASMFSCVWQCLPITSDSVNLRTFCLSYWAEMKAENSGLLTVITRKTVKNSAETEAKKLTFNSIQFISSRCSYWCSSFRSWCVKGTEESTFPLTHHELKLNILD